MNCLTYVVDGIKAILSPAGAWLWAELGNLGTDPKSRNITSKHFFIFGSYGIIWSMPNSIDLSLYRAIICFGSTKILVNKIFLAIDPLTNKHDTVAGGSVHIGSFFAHMFVGPCKVTYLWSFNQILISNPTSLWNNKIFMWKVQKFSKKKVFFYQTLLSS